MTDAPTFTIWSGSFGEYRVPEDVVRYAEAAASAINPKHWHLKLTVKEAVIGEWAKGVDVLDMGDA